MNPFKIVIIFLLLVGTGGCAQYLYSAYIPATAYNVATAIEGNNPESNPQNAQTLVASADMPADTKTEDIRTGSEPGKILDNMRTATVYFQTLLKSRQVENANDYVLTRVGNFKDGDFIMLAAVYRPAPMIEVKDAMFPGTTQVITDKSPAYYVPYRVDTEGRPLDRVVAWSLVPKECFREAHQQAAVLDDTADAVKTQKAAAGFWTAKNHWENGNVGQILLAGHLLSCPARVSS